MNRKTSKNNESWKYADKIFYGFAHVKLKTFFLIILCVLVDQVRIILCWD
nr:hypothetical protein SYMBAF_70032 [Serratia symbiotica]